MVKMESHGDCAKHHAICIIKEDMDMSLSPTTCRPSFPKEHIGQLCASVVVPQILAVDMRLFIDEKKHANLLALCNLIPDILERLPFLDRNIETRTAFCGRFFMEQLTLVFSPAHSSTESTIGKEFCHRNLDGPLFQMFQRFFGSFFRYNTKEYDIKLNALVDCTWKMFGNLSDLRLTNGKVFNRALLRDYLRHIAQERQKTVVRCYRYRLRGQSKPSRKRPRDPPLTLETGTGDMSDVSSFAVVSKRITTSQSFVSHHENNREDYVVLDSSFQLLPLMDDLADQPRSVGNEPHNSQPYLNSLTFQSQSNDEFCNILEKMEKSPYHAFDNLPPGCEPFISSPCPVEIHCVSALPSECSRVVTQTQNAGTQTDTPHQSYNLAILDNQPPMVYPRYITVRCPNRADPTENDAVQGRRCSSPVTSLEDSSDIQLHPLQLSLESSFRNDFDRSMNASYPTFGAIMDQFDDVLPDCQPYYPPPRFQPKGHEYGVVQNWNQRNGYVL